MTQVENFQWQAHYNQAMNRQFYATCAAMSDEARKRDMKAFFESIHGTLNHLLLTDKVWLGRIESQPFSASSLREILYEDFDELRAERERTDERIMMVVGNLNEQELTRVISYHSIMTNSPQAFSLGRVFTHLFLHQTHHRGQVSTLIGQLGYDFGETDILWIE
ncbi:DinB family protein [Hydrogenovibrio marinus]|uniref:DinB family protein n=1 Tax=Hydrogenovibrio marinus TaxID=28885 RepID=UPI0004A6BE7C|nr:DinB family protein [Hydrogenovibrio marinus]BBN59483.1 damage-inducible protein DinB [Hydrogenovibrio marinus]